MSNQTLLASPSAFLFNTGVDDSGALLPDGARDPHYALVGSSVGGPDSFAVPPGFPIPPWIANTDDSRWISPSDAAGADGAPGDYFYRTILDLTGIDPGTVYIKGLWSADDTAPDILVNGVSTGQPGSGLDGAAGFTISGAIGHPLVSGVNTIDFVVNNGGAAANPTGLRVQGVESFGVIAGLFDTGVDDNGDALPGGAADPHYAMSAPDGANQPPTALASPPSPPWVANGPRSRWIGPANDVGGNGPEGDYQYEITFDMTGLDGGTAVIEGLWSSDNGGTGILLNGVTTGNAQSGFDLLHPFEISAAAGDVFLPGLNTLTFLVNNAPLSNNPTGLRVADMVGYAAPIPEPGTLMLLLTGAVALAALRRQRRSAA